jgi:hypothetical protein
MAQYKVLSENCTLGKLNETVSIDGASGFNVDALIEGGHIQAVASKTSKTEQETKEN